MKFNHIFAALALASASIGAMAQSAPLNVTTTVLKSCEITVANTLPIATFAPATGTATSMGTANVGVLCTNTTPYSISISAGTHGTFAERRMQHATAAEFLAYNLYTTMGGSVVFGDGTSGTSSVTGVGTGASQTLTVYGRLATNQFVTPGSYSDTVTVSIAY